ncbi:MAG: hypothetical protein ABJH98_12965 [Reichenbachiella sp.]|uniref:hypothetical protein n=1 Tax=Reichenbachiella sp. TaxID=2184521 RepID=UPI00329A349D
MKNPFLSILLFGIFCTQYANAQSSDTHDKVKEVMVLQTEQLSLTTEQVPKVEVINLEFFSSVQDIKEGNGSRVTKFKSLKEADKIRTESMKTTLTDVQFKKFEEAKKENRKELKTRYKGSR